MITFQIDDRQVIDTLQQLQRRTANLQPIMDDIGQTVVADIQLNLGRGQTPWGEAMEPLKYRKGMPLNDTRQHISIE